MQYIEIGGKERPVLFGFGGLYAYEQRTGRRALEDFAKQAAAGPEAPESFSIVFLVDLVYCGLLAGCRANRLVEDFSEYDVADWLGSDTGLIEKVLAIFSGSFPQTEAKKKATPIRSPKSPPATGSVSQAIDETLSSTC